MLYARPFPKKGTLAYDRAKIEHKQRMKERARRIEELEKIETERKAFRIARGTHYDAI